MKGVRNYPGFLALAVACLVILYAPLVVVTHEADVAARTQRTIRLRDGKIVDTPTAAAAAG